MKKQSLFISALWLLGMLCGLAQESSLRLHFRTFSLDKSIDSILCSQGEGMLQVGVPSSSRSQVYNYRGKRTMNFFEREHLNSLKEGEVPKPVAKVTLPQNSKYLLLLFRSLDEPRDGIKYEVTAINDDPGMFKNGSMMFMNLSKVSMYFAVGKGGKDKFIIKPGELKPYALKEGFSGNLEVKVAAKKGSSFETLMHSRLFPSKLARDLYFVSPKSNPGKGHKVSIKQLRENSKYGKLMLDKAKTSG
ncbi:hypothetical protein [Persicirhabdus sediminis]|uniref:Uncharacterized protein n=1 Tax=Persicirhabdus sediminis TaxID=454144 RepID=A0A8J7MDQ0_9BACT|nr:hypothetical protein [Persicirhabdus sediminis]MBK1789964.1 hypothetical protein [Persicirhabdus sediminis]